VASNPSRSNSGTSVPETTMPRPTPVKIAPPAKPRRDAGTCGSTASAASTISAPPEIPAAKRQRKNHENETGCAQAKNDAVATSISVRKTTLTRAIAVIRRATSAPRR
jgi:hypothetical protein